MIAVLSPAKTLDFTGALPTGTIPTLPRLSDESAELARGASKLSKRKLGELMHISDKLAALDADRYARFEEQETRPALYAFAGDVYTGFEARTLESPAIAYAQDHVRILSGLYGLLRPLDSIRPYRLEMGTRWAPGRARTLYDWWGARIADLLADDVADEGSGTVLNLASQEYWRAVAGKLPASVRVIEVEFLEPGPTGPRFVSFHAKKARGMMARWMCEHHIGDVDAMRGFDSAGYCFDAGESGADRWRFVRTADPD